MARHLVLIGLPGAGKTTVGRIVADTLGTWFTDLDDEITQAEGTTIARIFAERGEVAFRALERDAMEAALDRPPGVIAPGGGWAAQPGTLDAIEARGFSLYLYTRVETAAQRTAGTGHRPLLGNDHVAALHRLFDEREASYRRADATIATDGRTPNQVAADVVALARSSGGW